ncbi:ricin-type beta-trefoil lectin domain protein [Streptomyces sp. NPDC091279]|uniref:ricin-type beta-trefoil lectin domain protein n=1 Tax=Streptomyces sp. NPDC091279 TaxID=3365983 RepID=UPI0037F6BAD8
MKDAGLSNSPASSDPRFEVTDEQLSAELKKWTGTTPTLQPVGELLDRHWEAAFAYARLCTDGPRAAGMLTTAAFTRLFGESIRHIGPPSAWRPRVLVTVRRIAAEWDTDRSRELLHPDLRTPTGGPDDRIAARLLPPAGRRLLSGAFQRLPQAARCVLWHVDVESEPLHTPAALLGLDESDALVELDRARERLREECLQVHRELAPEQECHRYLRMLDVTYRRGGLTVDPDLAAHLAGCTHCRRTARQLACFNDGLGVALAEAVLGWGAQAYVESRAGLAEPVPAPEESALRAMAGESFAGPDTPAPRAVGGRSAHKAARRAAARRRHLAAAVLTVGALIVVPLTLWAALGPGDDTADGAAPAASPETGRGTSDDSQSWAGTGADGELHGRLHNVDSGLCVGVAGTASAKVTAGAEAELQTCSTAAGQQWAYESDGLLRSGTDPNLCLDSRLGYAVRLAPCTGESGQDARNVRYDFTLQGTLVSRRSQDLALTPAATDGSGALVLKTRGDSATQRWVFDTTKADLQMAAVNWDAETTGSPTPKPTPTPKAARTPTPTPTAPPSTAAPTPSAATPAVPDCSTHPHSCGGRGGWGYGSGGGYGWGH